MRPNLSPPFCIIYAIALIYLSGCAPKIAPWERGYLTKPQLSSDGPLEAAIKQHVETSKEASMGGRGATGGGCGCS